MSNPEHWALYDAHNGGELSRGLQGFENQIREKAQTWANRLEIPVQYIRENANEDDEGEIVEPAPDMLAASIWSAYSTANAENKLAWERTCYLYKLAFDAIIRAHKIEGVDLFLLSELLVALRRAAYTEGKRIFGIE